MLDKYQQTVHQKFPKTSWLSNKANFERIVDWITFYRRNIPVFVEHYLGLSLHWYQIIWLYILNSFKTIVIIAGRASAKSYAIAIFSCAKCILWLSVSSVVMLLVSKIKNAITELKEVNSIMREISKTADQLSKADLSKVENTSYKTASKYGKKASNYLTGIQEMYRAGYENAEDLAELSTLAQAAGDMQADLAIDYLIATDAAYKLKGNTEALNDVLDGQNYITNRNALSMQDLAEATKIAASQSASSGIAIDQATAAMGTMIATTRQGGDVAARAWKGILMNIQRKRQIARSPINLSAA